MTPFHRAAPYETVFTQLLDRYYGGVADEATDAQLPCGWPGPSSSLRSWHSGQMPWIAHPTSGVRTT